MMLNGCSFDLLGHVTKGSLRVDDENWGEVSDFKSIYDHSLESLLS